jgi:hypothetical protein
MEGTEPGTRRRKPAPPTKRGLIIEAWNGLGRTMIGESELREILRLLHSQFGPGADESPAVIARVLADEGAELRHPEVIEFDARWREAKIEKETGQLKGLDELLAGKPLRLSKAEALIKKLERLRQRAENANDQSAAKQARSMAISGRQTSELLANDKDLNELQRAEQTEIAEWLKVWLQTPMLFADWLELRRRSPEFRKKFSD